MDAQCRLKPRLSIGFNLLERDGALQDKTSMEIDRVDELVAKNIESLLKEKGLKATVWSKDAGLSQTTVSDIISRKTKSPTYLTLMKLAKTAGVDVRRITVGPDYMKLDSDIAEMLDLMPKLTPQERKIVLGTGRASLASRDPSDAESDEGDQ